MSEPCRRALRPVSVSTVQHEPAVELASIDPEQTIDIDQQTIDIDEVEEVRPASSLADLEEQPRRPWGFVAFLVTALILATVLERRTEAPRFPVVAAASPLTVVKVGTGVEGLRTVTPQTLPDPRPATQRLVMKNMSARTARTRDIRKLVSFESSSITTTEGAVAAVFVLRRAPPRDGRMRVHWSARSGTADAAIDFSDASGIAVFADGQATAALYVPLRNDLLQEPDETFEVCLDSSQQARSRPPCAEVTIRDDDELLSSAAEQ